MPRYGCELIRLGMYNWAKGLGCGRALAFSVRSPGGMGEARPSLLRGRRLGTNGGGEGKPKGLARELDEDLAKRKETAQHLLSKTNCEPKFV